MKRKPRCTDEVVVHFSDRSVAVRVRTMAALTGQTPEEVRASYAALVEAGFLSPNPDGSYDATLPPDAQSEARRVVDG